MDELRKTNQHAYDWLKKKNPSHWSRSHFSIRSHSDMLVNNLFESFNKKKEKADKWKGMLCPKIKKKLDVNIKYSLRCVPSHAGGNKYQKTTSRPTKVIRKEPNETQTTERLSKRGVDMRCTKCKRIGHNKRSCKEEVGQNIPVKRHKVDFPTQQQDTPNQQESTPTQQATSTQFPSAPTHQKVALREKIPFKRRPTTVRWMPPTQGSSMIDH
ncbi:hypothetical protein GOBAR_AA16102 [Gossypium barbadense]|uniref:CCHC-type domain-containing protein n=1 Tax=Gossypium barbadense TaxID=3634 RepID=A0A2P5XMJ6_GOSBA|nr:hypothetical protein GOBAR_AA16102 [Gossypium barbadense]